MCDPGYDAARDGFRQKVDPLSQWGFVYYRVE